MSDDLRQRYAEALAAKFTNPIHRCDRDGENERVENPEPADRIAHTMAVHFTAGDGHPSFRSVTCEEAAEAVAAVRDEEMERLRRWERIASKDNAQLREEVTRLRINAEKDVCSGCMQREEQRDNWMRATREYGVKYKQEKERVLKALDRAEKAELVITRAENLRDKWLAWPTDDMHYAAGLMLAKYLSDEPPALDDTAGTKNDHVEP